MNEQPQQDAHETHEVGDEVTRIEGTEQATAKNDPGETVLFSKTQQNKAAKKLKGIGHLF